MKWVSAGLVKELVLFSKLERMSVCYSRAVPAVIRTADEHTIHLFLFRVARDVERTVFRT